MDLIPTPSALLSCLLLPLRGQESRQKQVGIGHRGRSQRICAPLMTRIFNEFRQGANPHSLGVGNIAQSIRQKTEGTIDSQRSDAVGRFDVHHVWFRYDDYRCISFLTTCLHKIRTA